MSWNSKGKQVAEDLGYAVVYRFNYFRKSKLYPLLSMPSPLNLFWAFWVLKIAHKECLDILVASNIRIAFPTILAAKILKKPIVLDLQENNEEMVKLRPKTRLAHYITRNGYIVRILEHLCIKMSDHVWVVIEEHLDDLPTKARKQGKVSVLRHTACLEDLRHGKKQRQKWKKEFTLIYIGRFTGDIGCIELILRALPYVLERDNTVKFIISGVEVGRKKLEALIENLGIQGHVELAGVIAPEEIPTWLQQGDVGVIPYAVNSFTNSTVSNKLFHYMAAGLPILSTDMAPTRRIVEEVRCGRIIPLGSSYREVADIILQLKNSSGEFEVMGQRAIQAIREKYNWNVDFSHALHSFEKLLSEDRK